MTEVPQTTEQLLYKLSSAVYTAKGSSRAGTGQAYSAFQACTLLVPQQIQMSTDLHTCTPKYNYASFKCIKCPSGNYTGESAYASEFTHQINSIHHFQTYLINNQADQNSEEGL